MNCPYCKSVRVEKGYGAGEVWCHTIYDGPITNGEWEFYRCKRCEKTFVVQADRKDENSE